ncbi:MAG: tRNA lysidine(34) synthetase TilS [Casimicrobiaceae bacterium]
MADTRRFPPAESLTDADIPAAVADLLARTLPNGGRIAVALSGGRDSIALLDAAVNVAASARCEVIALHVHHGLSSNAGAWSALCRDTCGERGIPFAMREVQVMRGARSSVEAMARAARYEALAALAREHGACAVLLAHHADDQAETTLLQLLRGAGPRGLAAMPSARLADGIWWLRPLLALPRASLDLYVAQRRLRYVDDESNADQRYRRNALRATIVPGLRALSPGYPGSFVRAAVHQAEAAALLDELAELDARSAWDGRTLDCTALRDLSAARGRNLLRWFLRQRGLRAPSSARLAEMLRQLTNAGRDTRLAIAHGGAELGLHRGRIVVHRAPPGHYAQEWTGTPSVELPHGTLVFAALHGAGIAARHLASSRVTIRTGVPGERLRLAGRASHRCVADLLREAGVPQWDRIGLPRVYCDEALAAVPCAGVDARFAATQDEAAFALEWQPRPT